MEVLAWGATSAVPEVVAECEGRLAGFVRIENVCDVLQIAHYHG